MALDLSGVHRERLVETMVMGNNKRKPCTIILFLLFSFSYYVYLESTVDICVNGVTK